MEKSYLTSLPDLVLVKIFSYFTISELLQTVARTCKHLNSIVECNSTLWSRFAPDWFSLVTKEQLHRILRHSVALTEFAIPYGSYMCLAPDIDFLFITELSNAKSLTWLDITDCPVSTLCFLKFLPNIEILNVSDCKNLVDADFHVLKFCGKLCQLYVSFTKVTPDTLLSVCDSLTLIVLDVSGIPLNFRQCERLLHPGLVYFQFTPDNQDDEPLFQGLFRRFRDTSVHIVHRILDY